MSIFIKEMIKSKIKQLRKDELLHHANKHGFSLSGKEADHILSYLKENEFDVFSKKDNEKLYKKLTEITDVSTANKAKQLFEQLIASYGLEDYFK